MSLACRILIIRLSSLGDIIHALPAYQSLRDSFPSAEIDWLVEKRAAFLLSAIPGIQQVHEIDTRQIRKAPLDAASWKPVVAAVSRLRARNYDRAVDFQGLLKTGLLCRLSGAPFRVGFSSGLVRERPAHWFYSHRLDREGPERHVVDLNLALARLAGATAPARPVEFCPLPEDERSVETLLNQRQLSDFVIINPGGGWETKQWRPERYGALAKRIVRELKLQVAVTTGPGEEELFRIIEDHSGGTRPAHLILPFVRLIPLLARARLVIGGDTGPVHLACALGVPVVAIHGPSSPIRNGPWGTRGEAVYRTLHCSFCYGRTCPRERECMDLGEGEVFDAVQRCLQGASSVDY